MVMFVQFWHYAFIPLSNNTERLEFVRLYEGSGELCNIRLYWSEQRIKLIIAYIFAVTLKVYNSYKFTQFSIQLEAKQRECSTEDVIRERYFDFYWNQLPYSEERNSDLYNCFWCWCAFRSYGKKDKYYLDDAKSHCCSCRKYHTHELNDGIMRGGFTYGLQKKKKNRNQKKWRTCLPTLFTDMNNPLLLYIISANFLLMLMLILNWAFEESDNQIINMVIICFFDVIVDGFQIFPNWQRRQMLLIDEILRIFYGEADLWHIEIYQQAFRQENFKRKTALPIYISELKMIEKYYGKFGVHATYFDRETVRKSNSFYNQPNDFLKLRTLAQNELIL